MGVEVMDTDCLGRLPAHGEVQLYTQFGTIFFFEIAKLGLLMPAACTCPRVVQ
jgi:hypothetical protein